jgi:hypothetical protein
MGQILKQRSMHSSDFRVNIEPGDIVLPSAFAHVIIFDIGYYDSELDKALFINFKNGKLGFSFVTRRQKQKEIHSA